MFVSFLVAVEVDRFISAVEISVRAGEKSIHRTFGEGPAGSVGQSSYVRRAKLTALLGDDAGRERELREAQRLYTEMGATGHAERVGRELAHATQR